MDDNQPEFTNVEVPVTLTFDEWTLVSASLIVAGHPATFELHEKIMAQVVTFSEEVNGA
jgi:hypothetical protein